MLSKSDKIKFTLLNVQFNKENSKLIIDDTMRQLTPYVGKDIVKQNGEFLKKIPFKKLEFERESKFNKYGFGFCLTVQYWFEYKWDTLRVCVNTVLRSSDNNSFHHQQVNSYTLFNMKGTAIDSINEQDRSYLTKFDSFEDVMQNIQKAEELRTQLSDVITLIPHEVRSIN